jgi:hypothetical protein
MPGCGDHVFPSVKERQQCRDVKFRSWVGVQALGFADAVDAFIKTGSDAVLSKFARENQVLAYEICHMVDGRLLTYIVKVDKTYGALLLRTLNAVATRGSAERTAGLHSRVLRRKDPSPPRSSCCMGSRVDKKTLKSCRRQVHHPAARPF